MCTDFSRSDRKLVEPISQGPIDFVGKFFVLNGGNINIVPGTIFSDDAPIILRTFWLIENGIHAILNT